MIPNRLKKGDIVGVVALSSCIKEHNIPEMERAKKLLEECGLEVKYGKNLFLDSTGYGATAKEKAEELNEMFGDKNIKAIFNAKGGANSNSIFDYIDYELIKKNPKIFCGYSDTTSVSNIITEKTGLITFSGNNFKSFGTDETDYSYREMIKRFIQKDLLLGNKDDEYKTIQTGETVGELIGGNLSLISRLVEGKYKIDFQDKILFIEELWLESDPEMVSNYLYYMKQNEVFEKVRGIWVGNYEGDVALEKILLDTLDGEYDFPIIKSNNFGHGDRRTVIPIGTKAKIDTNNERKIELLEDCIK